MDLQPYYAKHTQRKIKSKEEENCFCLCQHHSIRAAFSFPAAVILLLLSCILPLPWPSPPHLALDKHLEKKVQPATFSPVHHLAASHSHIPLFPGAVHRPPNEEEALLCCALDKSLLPAGFQGKMLWDWRACAVDVWRTVNKGDWGEYSLLLRYWTTQLTVRVVCSELELTYSG